MEETQFLELIENMDKIIVLHQTILYTEFVILGGLCAIAFFSFWKRIFG
jgi:hypothetical protein